MEAERIDLPNGSTVWYIDENHSYWGHNPKTDRKGKRLTGVTTVVKTLDHDPSNLLRWAARTQCIGVAGYIEERLQADPACLHNVLDVLNDPQAIWRELEQRNLTYNDVRDKAASEGTNVHRDAFEALASGRPVPAFDEMTEREVGLAQGVAAFWLDHEPEVVAVEQVVYSERLGVAGRLDFYGRIKGRDGLGVLDLKTGKYLSVGAHTQVGGGYPLLARECGVGEPEWAAMLQVRDDGTYELIDAEGTSEDFEAAVAAYRAAGRINRDARRAYKERKELVAA